jgi:hypothetical protein
MPWFLAHNEGMKVDMECYAGRKADERPVRFKLEGKQYGVGEVLDRWYEPDSIFYKLRANDGNLYISDNRLRCPTGPGIWSHFAKRKKLIVNVRSGERRILSRAVFGRMQDGQCKRFLPPRSERWQKSPGKSRSPCLSNPPSWRWTPAFWVQGGSPAQPVGGPKEKFDHSPNHSGDVPPARNRREGTTR